MREAMAAEAAAAAAAVPSYRPPWGGPSENASFYAARPRAPAADDGDGGQAHERRRPVRRSGVFGWHGRGPMLGGTGGLDAAPARADVPSPPLIPMSPTYSPTTPDYLDWVPRRADAATETDGQPSEEAGHEAPGRAPVNLLDVLFLGMLHARSAAASTTDTADADADSDADAPLPTAGAASRRRIDRSTGSGV